MSKYSSSIAKYNEIIEYQNYDDYISDMEIYQILNHSDSNVDFIISSGNADEEMELGCKYPIKSKSDLGTEGSYEFCKNLTTSTCSSDIIKRSHKPSIK